MATTNTGRADGVTSGAAAGADVGNDRRTNDRRSCSRDSEGAAGVGGPPAPEIECHRPGSRVLCSSLTRYRYPSFLSFSCAVPVATSDLLLPRTT